MGSLSWAGSPKRKMNHKGIKFIEIQTTGKDWKATAIRLAHAEKPFVLIGFDLANHKEFYEYLNRYNLNVDFDIAAGNTSFWPSNIKPGHHRKLKKKK